jgi:hypothetical protein
LATSTSPSLAPEDNCDLLVGKAGFAKPSFVVDTVIKLLIELEVPGRSPSWTIVALL